MSNAKITKCQMMQVILAKAITLDHPDNSKLKLKKGTILAEGYNMDYHDDLGNEGFYYRFYSVYSDWDTRGGREVADGRLFLLSTSRWLKAPGRK